MPLTLDAKVSHADIATFADARVNLKRDDVAELREQSNRLRNRLADYIAEHRAYDLVKMLHSGSLAKGTALKTLNDIDVAVYVSKATAPDDETSLLYWLEARLKEAYGGWLKPDQFHIAQHCVTISFRGTGLDVDVVPVLYEGDSNDYGLLTTKDTGKQVRTSIPLHREFIRSRKDAQPKHFAQLVRLVKWWARGQKALDTNFRLKSFIIELILAHLADDGLDCSDYPTALQSVFAYIVRSELKETIRFKDFATAGNPDSKVSADIKIYDPVNAQNNVAATYSDQNRRAIVEAAQVALDAVAYARSAPTQAIAVEEWSSVLPGFSV